MAMCLILCIVSGSTVNLHPSLMRCSHSFGHIVPKMLFSNRGKFKIIAMRPPVANQAIHFWLMS